MLSYQQGFFAQTQILDAETFARLVISDQVVNTIKAIRQRRAEGNTQEADRLKRSLPGIIWQATFDESVSKGGNRGMWRKQAAARLNGLFMLDVDHVKAPRAVVQSWIDNYIREQGIDGLQPAEQRAAWAQSLGVLMVSITSSNEGIRLVAIADVGRGNLADNQAWLARELNVEMDESCIDASRTSFCPSFEDIIFINKEKIFTYHNDEYDNQYGEQYRHGNSRPSASNSKNNSNHRSCTSRSASVAAGNDGRENGASSNQVGESQSQIDKICKRLKEGYHGTSYKELIEKWFQLISKGYPQPGDRHRTLYQLACDLRYVCDFDPQLLAAAIGEHPVGAEIANERGREEILRIASDACALQRWRSIPKRLQPVLESLHLLVDEQDADGKVSRVPQIDYKSWWERLEPLLSDSPGLKEAVADLPDHLKMGGVLAAGAMLGTYLTRCWWEHFDGKEYRLSFLVYIVGGAASGKSFIIQMDRLLMAPMRAADNAGRELERQYKEEAKRRSLSSKEAKGQAPEQPHPVIRYVPSTISNAMLYRRLTDAIDKESTDPDGEPMHLHCYTCEAELSTALRVQQGSWAGKLDLECKSFQNETAGVDYANDQSTNGIIQVNWNQVVSGTPDAMSRKIRPATVLDGLVTRLCLFPMPENDFVMLERQRRVRDFDRECMLRSLGLWLEEVKGCLDVPRLVDFCFDYESRLCKQAQLEQDECLDYFRKRIPLIMMRYTLVRMVLRQKEKAMKGEPLEVTDDDLKFAELIGDFVLTTQMHMFGSMVMDALKHEKEAFVPQRRMRKMVETFGLLKQEFSIDDMVALSDLSATSAKRRLYRWIDYGFIEKTGKNTFKKLIQSIA